MNQTARPWWQSATVYQIYIRSYQDSNGDGIGDLAGILSRVPYLKKLGVDAIWITPFYPSPMADFGYDVSDYCNVDPSFGTLEDFDRLRDALHAQGMKILIDIVPNHTSNQHPWFKEAVSSKQSKKRDWYIWHDPAPDGGVPNNWWSLSGGPAWQFDQASGQYYMHSFLAEQPDLNWRNPDVRHAFYDVMRFWLDRGVDGFRVDVIGGLMKDPDFKDDPVNEDYKETDPDFLRLKAINSSNRPETMEVITEMRGVLAEYQGDRVLIGELYNPIEDLIFYYGKNCDGVHLPFNFSLMWVEWTAKSVMALVSRFEALLPQGAWPTWVLGNHDQPRIVTRLGPAQARLGMMLMLTLRGTPTLYQGEELGLENAEIPADEIHDLFAKAGKGQGRDGERTPMPWDQSLYHGFSTQKPWLRLGADSDRRNVAQQENDKQSMLQMTRALLHLRKQEPALSHGDWTPLTADEHVLSYERSNGGQRFVVMLNLTDRSVRAELPPYPVACVLSTMLDQSHDRNAASDHVTLRPHEGVIFKAV
jgi:alpha-glucosidase